MRRAKNNLLVSLLLLLWLFAGARAAEISRAATGEAILKHARYLASDELMGRGVDTPGLAKARDYITEEFRRYGLAPGGAGGAYVQGLEVVSGVKARDPSAFAFGDGPNLRLNEDWIPLGLSSSGAVAGEVVFVGYGITAKDYGYDDYAGVDAKGKIALVLRYEPPPKSEKSPFRKLPNFSSHSTLRAKAANARNHGAAAMVLVDLQPERPRDKELISIARTMGRGEGDLLAVQVKRSVAEKYLEAGGVSLSQLKERIDREEKPASMPLPGLKISIAVSLEKITQTVHNVIGILSGSDPRLRDEVIVVGAHYDHLGLGAYGTRDSSAEGQIHNGADDNASGTSVLLALASSLSRLPEKPPRTIVFAAFAGEELGLYGSRYLVAHPPVPLASIKAMINLDMVGRMKDNAVSVSGTGSAKEFQNLVDEAGRPLGIAIRGSSRNSGGSDHTPFYQKGIPVLHFHTGLHEDYHRPTDDWEKLNIEGMVKMSDLVLAVLKKLASAQEPPTFVPVASN